MEPFISDPAGSGSFLDNFVAIGKNKLSNRYRYRIKPLNILIHWNSLSNAFDVLITSKEDPDPGSHIIREPLDPDPQHSSIQLLLFKYRGFSYNKVYPG
jgi:hypothetical protein